MRIAVTYEDGKIGQHFGRTEEFKIYDVEDGEIIREEIISNGGRSHGMLAYVLEEQEVDLLICGGIGPGARQALESVDVDLIPGVSGDPDAAVRAYLSGELEYDPEASCNHHGHEEDHDCSHERGCGGYPYRS